MATIRSAVGKGVKQHNSQDVLLIQKLLNQNRPVPLRHLQESGLINQETIQAIEEFQKRVVKMAVPDGRVDPGGKTFKALDAKQGAAFASASHKTKSGRYWVTWADTHAKNSSSVEDLEAGFKAKVKEFIKALEDAGATVSVSATKRHENRAYLFHWSWKISLGKAKPSEATAKTGVDIEWDHGDLAKSKAGAKEMVDGFGLAVPPKSTVAPSLTSNHITGHAIDMDITWSGDLKVKKKDGTEVTVAYMSNVNSNTKLHAVGESYGVKKHTSDAPHWSHNGK